MRRREFLTGLALLGGARLLPGLTAATPPDPARGPTCRPDGLAGMEICDARACTFLASVAPNAQENTNWCWAACLEMSFSCLGYRVSQQEIVKATWGDIRNAPASASDMVKSVQREYVDFIGDRFRPKAKLLDRTFTIFTLTGALSLTFEHVAAGKPAIVGTLNPDGSGHATMLTNLSVRRPTNRSTSPELSSARVYDPWFGRGSRVFTQEDWDRSPYVVLVDL
ncbi:MAG: hypothetical protein ABI592_11395 [Acidobacteriota bacterium]